MQPRASDPAVADGFGAWLVVAGVVAALRAVSRPASGSSPRPSSDLPPGRPGKLVRHPGPVAGDGTARPRRAMDHANPGRAHAAGTGGGGGGLLAGGGARA